MSENPRVLSIESGGSITYDTYNWGTLEYVTSVIISCDCGTNVSFSTKEDDVNCHECGKEWTLLKQA